MAPFGFSPFSGSEDPEEMKKNISADMHGVWAGLTSRQLAAEQRRRGVKPTKPT